MGKEGYEAGLWSTRPSNEKFKAEFFAWFKDYKCVIQMAPGDPRDPTFNNTLNQMGLVVRTAVQPLLNAMESSIRRRINVLDRSESYKLSRKDRERLGIKCTTPSVNSNEEDMFDNDIIAEEEDELEEDAKVSL